MTPPAPFLFELVDATTGENLISDGPLKSRNLFLDDVRGGDSRAVAFTVKSENGRMIIFTNEIGWKTEEVDIYLSTSLKSTSLFRLRVSAVRISKDCCQFTRFDEIRLMDANYEFEENTGIYRVEVEL